jgi:hypothetical protein
MYKSFAINCFVKKRGTTILLALIAHKKQTFSGWSMTLWVRCGFSELQ